MRRAVLKRKTSETKVSVELDLDGKGNAVSNTGIAFLDHLLDTLARHSKMDLRVESKGDLDHHVTEDVAIALGESIKQALGNRNGITRFGSATVPMDEALAQCSIDLVRRPFAITDLQIRREMLEDMAGEDVEHFLRSFANSAEICIHVKVQYGDNDHHKAEAGFKAIALSLRQAWTRDGKGAPSTKGVL